MRFEADFSESATVLRAIFEPGDSPEGRRVEGAGAAITYSGDEVFFDYGPRSIHPDLLGLLCLLIFYPFIGERVLFAEPVSPRLEEAFRRGSFDRQFRFDNVSDNVEHYTGSEMALSFGGGTDSGAVLAMFPEAFVVHEAHVRGGRLVPSFAHRVVRELGPDRARVIASNQRYVSQPGGWHGWTCAFAAALLMATDHGFGIILSGSGMEGTLLAGGTRHFDRFKSRSHAGVTGNAWQSAFNTVGLPVFSPVCGASAFATSEVSLELARAGRLFSCILDSGAACMRCSKCLRKDLNRAVVDPWHTVRWDAYDHPGIHGFLASDPLPQGHVFAYARGRVSGLPDFIDSRIDDLPAILTLWPRRHHADTIELCDPRWRPMIGERILEHLEVMTPEDIAEMQQWSSTRRRA